MVKKPLFHLANQWWREIFKMCGDEGRNSNEIFHFCKRVNDNDKKKSWEGNLAGTYKSFKITNSWFCFIKSFNSSITNTRIMALFEVSMVSKRWILYLSMTLNKYIGFNYVAKMVPNEFSPHVEQSTRRMLALVHYWFLYNIVRFLCLFKISKIFFYNLILFA